MDNDLKQKIIKYRNLGWSNKKIRRCLLLRKSVFKYLMDNLPRDYVTDPPRSHKQLLKFAKTVDSHRPKSNVLIDQCPIHSEDLVKRVEIILENEFPISNKKILFIGDDDLASCVLTEVSSPKFLGLIDIDDRILKLLKETAINHKNADTVLAQKGNIVDIVQKKVKDPFEKTLFDIFVSDPPYTETGYNFFLNYGFNHLKLAGRAYIAVPYMNIEEWTNELLFKVEKFLLENGFVVEHLIPGFALYQHDDSVVSSMVIAKKVSKPLSLIETAMPSLNKMYTTKYPVQKLNIDS